MARYALQRRGRGLRHRRQARLRAFSQIRGVSGAGHRQPYVSLVQSGAAAVLRCDRTADRGECPPDLGALQQAAAGGS